MAKILTAEEETLFDQAVLQADMEVTLRESEVVSLSNALIEAQAKLARAEANAGAAAALRDKLAKIDV